MSGLSLAWRIAAREMRGGLRGFGVFLTCLALAVAALAAVGTVRAAIQAGLARDGAALLGGDAEVQLTYRFATGDERAVLDRIATAVSETAEFRSMATVEGGERALTQVKAVDDAYPVAGSFRLQDGGDLQPALAERDARARARGEEHEDRHDHPRGVRVGVQQDPLVVDERLRGEAHSQAGRRWVTSPAETSWRPPVWRSRRSSPPGAISAAMPRNGVRLAMIMSALVIRRSPCRHS